MKRLFIYIILLFCAGYYSTAQTVIPQDTASVIVVRNVQHNKIEEWKQSKDFNYERSSEGLSLLQRIRMQILNWLGEFFSDKQRADAFWVVFTVICLSIVAFAIYKLTGMSAGSMFERSSKRNLSFDETEENINEINFEAAIAQAENNNNLRLALRYQYLKLLKYLSDKGAILWKPEKTNHDYILEMNRQPEFIQLTNEFEYTWYGEREISEEAYEEAKAFFNRQQNKN